MAVYIYIYSDYPAANSRKYYVGDYRKRNAYTYQVVPQLQRTFDRRGYEDKSALDEERFETLRRRGYLYTENRAEKRSSLYAAPDPAEVPAEWRPLGAWLAGARQPGAVDWRELGRLLRERLGRGEPLPEVLANACESIETEGGPSFGRLYEAVRRRHIEQTWFHRLDDCTFGQLAAATSRDWEFPASGAAGTSRAGGRPAAQFRPSEIVRESRPASPAPDESEWRRQLGEALDLGEDCEWEAIIDQLGDPATWYETVEYGGEPPLRVPEDDLYEVQWRLEQRLSEAGLHHECATALEVDAPGALHARFHTGANAAVVVELQDYPGAITEADLRSELRLESKSGAFSAWSSAGLEILVELLVDPDRDRLSAAAPSSTAAAEFALWEVDDRLCRRAAGGWGGESGWVYSRLGEEIVLSARERVPRRVLADVVGDVSDVLEENGLAIADGGVALWSPGGSALEVGDLAVPAQWGDPVEFADDRRSRLREAADRARDSEENDADRRLLEEAYRISGDIRYATLGIPSVRSDVRDLLFAMTLREFRDAIWEGWYGTIGG